MSGRKQENRKGAQGSHGVEAPRLVLGDNRINRR